MVESNPSGANEYPRGQSLNDTVSVNMQQVANESMAEPISGSG